MTSYNGIYLSPFGEHTVNILHSSSGFNKYTKRTIRLVMKEHKKGDTFKLMYSHSYLVEKNLFVIPEELL